MGWKSTKDITREQALLLIHMYISSCGNDKLGDVLENLGFGEDTNLPHYGYNFNVVDEIEEYKRND